MALSTTTAWSLGTAGLCVALSAASWFLVIDPERAEAATSREQTVAVQQNNAALVEEIDRLKEQFADLPSKQAELAAIRQALPDQPAMSSLVRDLSAAAADSGLQFDSVTTGAATALVDPAAAVVAPGSTDEGAPAEPTGTESEPAGADPADGVPVEGGEDAAATEAAPVDGTGVTTVEGGPAGAVLASIPVTIEVSGDFFATTLYLKALQTQVSRAVLVDNINVTVDDSEDRPAGTVVTTVSARVFVFVDPQSIDVTGTAGATTE